MISLTVENQRYDVHTIAEAKEVCQLLANRYDRPVSGEIGEIRYPVNAVPTIPDGVQLALCVASVATR